MNFLKNLFTQRLYIFKPKKSKLPHFKNSNHLKHLCYIHPLLVSIMFDMAWYCENNEIPFNITSVIRSPIENARVGGKTKTHETGRAFDISVKGWTVYDIDTFVQTFNKKYKNDAAISTDGKPRLVVYHIGTAEHLHIQIHSRFSRENVWANL